MRVEIIGDFNFSGLTLPINSALLHEVATATVVFGFSKETENLYRFSPVAYYAMTLLRALDEMQHGAVSDGKSTYIGTPDDLSGFTVTSSSPGNFIAESIENGSPPVYFNFSEFRNITLMFSASVVKYLSAYSGIPYEGVLLGIADEGSLVDEIKQILLGLPEVKVRHREHHDNGNVVECGFVISKDKSTERS
jgi:hypothetical protein